MRIATLAAIAASLSLATQARADFVITGHRAPAPPPIDITQVPPPDPPAPAQDVTPAHPAPPHFFMAYGFGDDIPLRFAIRQIVPHAVRVTYGPGADPKALVSWKGGQTWNRVLMATVAPLGLRLVMTQMAVEITK